MTWGCVFFDYDHDGEWDLYIVNDYQFAPLPNILYHGNGDNTFTPVSGGDAYVGENGVRLWPGDGGS